MLSAEQQDWAIGPRPWSDPTSTAASSPLDLVNAEAHGIFFRPAVVKKRNVQLAVGVPWFQARQLVYGERIRNNVSYVRESVVKGGPGDFWDSGLSATFRRGNNPLPRVHEYGSNLPRFLLLLAFDDHLFRYRSCTWST